MCRVNLSAVSVLLLLLHGVTFCSSARVLISVTNAMASKSHSFSLAAISAELVSRGHHVTVLSGSNKGTTGFGRSAYNDSIIYQIPYSLQETKVIQDRLMRAAFLKRSIVDYADMLSVAGEYFKVIATGCKSLFDEPSHLDRLRREAFDAIIGIPICSCDALLAEYLNVTFIAFTATFRYEAFSEDLFGIPAPTSYVPFPLIEPLTDEMTFPQRVYNLLYRPIFVGILLHFWEKPFVALQRDHGISPHLTLGQISGKAKLWLAHTDFALDFPRPTAPVWIPVGGLITKPSSKLSQEFESFVQGAGKHGVIVFSLGSTVTSLMDDTLNELFATVFSELPQRVLWRFVGPTPRTLGNNTMLVDWLPQNDLLGHPQTRLLIYHGGINGVYEALYHKVPMVLLPIFADQPAMGARVSKKGIGVILDRTRLSHDTVKGAIQEVLHNPKYKVNIERYSSIHHDTISSPLDKAVFWIEHVLKFGGDHLRLRGSQLSSFVLYSVDVVAFLVLVASVVIYLNYLFMKKFFGFILARCRPPKSKPKTN